jgi:hypothetical protein
MTLNMPGIWDRTWDYLQSCEGRSGEWAWPLAGFPELLPLALLTLRRVIGNTQTAGPNDAGPSGTITEVP